MSVEQALKNKELAAIHDLLVRDEDHKALALIQEYGPGKFSLDYLHFLRTYYSQDEETSDEESTAVIDRLQHALVACCAPPEPKTPDGYTIGIVGYICPKCGTKAEETKDPEDGDEYSRYFHKCPQCGLEYDFVTDLEFVPGRFVIDGKEYECPKAEPAPEPEVWGRRNPL